MTHPRTFAEFYEQNPQWVRFLAMRLLRRGFADDDVLDLEQYLLLSLLEKRTVEKYDPSHYTNAGKGAFYAYLKTCLTNMYYLRHKRNQTQRRRANEEAVSLSDPIGGEDEPITLEDALGDEGRKAELIDVGCDIQLLYQRLERRDPQYKLRAVLDRRLLGDTYDEIAEELQITRQGVVCRIQRIGAICHG